MNTKFRQYKYYMWIYIIGTILTLVSSLVIQNANLLYGCLFVLYCILFYKGVHILYCYKKAKEKAYQSFDKKKFSETYNIFRLKVALFWLAFIVLCIIGKFVIKIDYHYFYICTYFFLALDRVFVNVGCLLQMCSDPSRKIVKCCCGCPCRGWDLLMIHTPLLFALNNQNMIENLFIILSSILAVLTIIGWEKEKYFLVEVRKKCVKTCDLNLCREHK